MRDFDIRKALRAKLMLEHKDEPGTLILDEFVMQMHFARADIAVVNGMLNGYEIKSGQDTLIRLPNQQEIYSRVFDRVTAVVEARHVEGVSKIIPEWWGIMVVATNTDGDIEFTVERPSQQNTQTCSLALAQLLWKDEAVFALRQAGISRGIASKPKSVLWKKLAEHFQCSELSAVVRECLKSRQNWRPDLLRT